MLGACSCSAPDAGYHSACCQEMWAALWTGPCSSRNSSLPCNCNKSCVASQCRPMVFLHPSCIPNTLSGRMGSHECPWQLSTRALSGAPTGAASLPPACPWQHVPPPDGHLQWGPSSSPSTTASPSLPSLSSHHFGLLHSAAQEELWGLTVSLPPALAIPHGLRVSQGCGDRDANGATPTAKAQGRATWEAMGR